MKEAAETPIAVDAGRTRPGVPLTRIYIDNEGNLVITDLWDVVQALVSE